MNWIRNIIISGLILMGIAAFGQTKQIRIPDSTANPGEFINIPVYMDSTLTGENVVSYQLKIYFNTAIVNFVSALSSGTMSAAWGDPTYNVSGGSYINIANAGASPLVGSGKLFYLRFEVLTSGSSSLNFSGGTLENFLNEGLPELTFDNGSLYVPPPPQITVSPNSGLMIPGESMQFNVSGGTAPYNWSLSNPAIGSINSSGIFFPTSHGFTKIICEDDNGIVDETDQDIEVRAMEVSMPNVTEWQGGTISVPINITSIGSGLGILSGSIPISFNGNILTPTGFNTTGTLLEGYSSIVANNLISGTYEIAFAGTVPLSGNGVLIYVNFDISSVNTGNSNLGFGSVLFNEALPARTSGGYFTMQNYSTIYVSPSTASLVAGESQQFSASGGLPPYNWSISDNTIATIDGAGILTATASGTLTVTATDQVGATGTSGTITLYDTWVTLPDVYASLGTQYDLPVLISPFVSGSDIYSVQGTISFRSPELEALSIVTTGTMTAGWSFAYNVVGNTITFAGAGTNGFNSAGAMFKIKFQLTANLTDGENAWVNFDEIILNEGTPYPTLVNGSITGYGGIVLDLKAYLEGPFNGSNMDRNLNPMLIPNSQPYGSGPFYYYGSEYFGAVPNSQVVDWVLVELRETSGAASTATPGTMIARQAALLLNNGDIVGVDGSNNLVFGVVPTTNLYVALWHRNHLGIMSAVPLTESGGVYSYDFSLGSGYVYGGSAAHIQLAPGIWGMIAGNGDGNGLVDSNDIDNVWYPDAAKQIYSDGDFNLDSQTDNKDKNDVWLPNLNKMDFVPD